MRNPVPPMAVSRRREPFQPQALERSRGRPGYRIENAAAATAKIYIYDVIAWYAVNADDFVKDLNQVTAKKIELHVNSPGGDVFEGITIYNALRAHPAEVETCVDGLAASIASVIALAGTKVRIAEGAFFMVHNPAAGVWGEAKDLRHTADVLDKVGDSIAGIYAAATGRSVKEMLEAMEAETWYGAAEAMEFGFADQVDGAAADTAAEARWDLSVYNRVPAELAAKAAAAATPAEPSKRAISTIRDLEAFLRDEGGFSHAAARAIAAGGYKAVSDAGAAEATTDPRDEDGGAIELFLAAQRRGSVLAQLTTR
jgi:ATP-dependent Clp endopeptidase proteolytic subunit ClpP